VPTFKEKAAQFPKAVNMGLLDYPVLMAADILLYKSTIVPVGEDQLPHLELTREIARTFNTRFGKTFPEPQPYLGPGARIMSLAYPEKKMSKSLGLHNYIALADGPEIIRDKIAKAVTDVGPRGKVMSPGVANLFHLLELFSTKETVERFKKLYDEGTLMYSDLKAVLVDDLIKALEPFRERRARFARKPKEVLEILRAGGEAAQKIAGETLREVKEKTGLLYF
jgi:tryptophanyl-tRNA synthetase